MGAWWGDGDIYGSIVTLYDSLAHYLQADGWCIRAAKRQTSSRPPCHFLSKTTYICAPGADLYLGIARCAEYSRKGLWIAQTTFLGATEDLESKEPHFDPKLEYFKVSALS